MDGLDVIGQLSAVRTELVDRRAAQATLEERARSAEARARELEERVAELEANAIKTAQRDGLTRADERFLFHHGAELEFHLPQDGGGRLKLKTRRGGAPTVLLLEPDELFKKRALRTICGMARNARGPHAKPGVGG